MIIYPPSDTENLHDLLTTEHWRKHDSVLIYITHYNNRRKLFSTGGLPWPPIGRLSLAVYLIKSL